MGDEGLSYATLLRDGRLVAITLVTFVATFGTHAAAPVLPAMVTGLSVSEGEVGLVMAAYTLPAVVLLPLFGVLTDVYGRRPVLLPSLVLFGGAGVAIAFVDSFAAVVALRAVQGIGGAALIPVAITLVGDYYSGPESAAAQGIRLSANGVSGIALPVAAGFLAGSTWSLPFVLYGVALPVVLFAAVALPEPEAGQGGTDGETEGGSVRGQVRRYARELRAELTDRDLAIVLLGGFVKGFSYYAILTYVPLFAVDALAASTFLAGAVLSSRGVARIVFSPATGVLMTRLTRRSAMVLTLAVTALATGLVGFAPTVLVLGVLVGAFGVGDALYTPVLTDSTTALASDDRRAGVVSGMIVLRQLGTTLSPVVFGVWLVVFGFESLFLVAGGVYAAYALLVLVAFEGETKPTPDPGVT